MSDLTITTGSKRTTVRNRRMYSSIIWKNLLHRIINHFGIEILFQFGFNTKIIDRMVSKGLLGWEVDILSALRKNRDNIQVKYLKRWEFELFQWLIPKYMALANLKPVAMLSVFRSSNRDIVKLPKHDYAELMFNSKLNNRYLLDRTTIYDALIRFICELHEQQEKLTSEQFEGLLTHDYAKDREPNTPAWQLFTYFNSFSMDCVKHQECIIQRKAGLSASISGLYSEIRKRYSIEGIGNIKEYSERNCWPYIKVFHNLSYVNFHSHLKQKIFGTAIPNIFLQAMRDLSKKYLSVRIFKEF